MWIRMRRMIAPVLFVLVATILGGTSVRVLGQRVAESSSQELVTGSVISVDNEKHQITVSSSSESKALGKGTVAREISVGHFSGTEGKITSDKAVQSSAYKYVVNISKDVQVTKGGSAATLADIRTGTMVQLFGTLVLNDPTHKKLENYEIVNGQIVLHASSAEKTGTANRIEIIVPVSTQTAPMVSARPHIIQIGIWIIVGVAVIGLGWNLMRRRNRRA